MSFERPNIRKMSGYASGEQPSGERAIKLNTNENPYPPSPHISKVVQNFDYSRLNLYPDPDADSFREAASKLHDVHINNIVATRGGDELLRLIVTTFVDPGETIGMTSPTYSLYPVLAEIQDCPVTEIELTENWLIPTHFAEYMNSMNVKLALLVNPHAPSGSFLKANEIDNLARKLNSILVVDEAYVDFVAEGMESSIGLISKHPNLIVLRSLSKGYSLAGIRMGYGVGNEDLMKPIRTKTKDSYNLDQISQMIAELALKDQAYAKKTWVEIRKNREKMELELKAMGFNIPESQANFLLATVPKPYAISAYQLYEKLREREIFVRHFDTPRLKNKIRISVGLPEQNQELINTIDSILATTK